MGRSREAELEFTAYKPSKILLGNLEKGADLLGGIEQWCRGEGVACGLLWVIGSLSRATLAFYDQELKAYDTLELPGPLEIVSGTGNISLKDGQPFCHVHLVVSDTDGKTGGGHLVPGCTVFAAEVHLLELEGQAPVRRPDGVTGLNLWRFGK